MAMLGDHHDSRSDGLIVDKSRYFVTGHYGDSIVEKILGKAD
jgi:hypothetical protein